MHKIILALLLTTSLAASANAQNCVNASRCDELGYTKTAADCDSLDTLKCPFDSGKAFCSGGTNPDGSEDCKEGDILFSDKSCAAGLQPGKTAIGVVFVVFSSTSRLAVALDEKELEWGGSGKEIGSAAQGTSGKSNTAAILAYGKANNISYPAAEYCNTYSTAGTKAGDWFLPSLEELKILSNNFSEINNSLKVLGKAMREATDGYYWSSSESTYSTARRLVPSSGGTDYTSKDTRFRVRPVLAF